MSIQLGFIGFGEAARAFWSGWQGAGVAVRAAAFDIKTEAAQTADAMRAAYDAAGVAGCADSARAVSGAEVVFSMVTADQALRAAQSAAPHLGAGALYFDCNSCAPGTKRQASEVIEAAGGVYVDTAVMAPVHPKLHKCPLLLASGAEASAMHMAERLDLSARFVGAEIGRASTIKMIRSVMIKGLEALSLECFLSAQKAGVEDEIFASLNKSFPDWDWQKRAAYNFERTTTHGLRRASEMREVAKTVDELGLNNGMSRATVDWQQAMGDLGLSTSETDFDAQAALILGALASKD